jgi:hypothetical protein
MLAATLSYRELLHTRLGCTLRDVLASKAE